MATLAAESKDRRSGSDGYDRYSCRYLSCRVNLQHLRRRAYDARRWDAGTKRRFKLDRAAIEKLETSTKPVIRTLERLMKRANRQFLKVSPWTFESCSKEWRWHLRWIRFHLAYFNPPSIPGSLRRF